jgi:hypothetical protein
MNDSCGCAPDVDTLALILEQDVWMPCEDDLTNLYEPEEPLANANALWDDDEYEPVRIYA